VAHIFNRYESKLGVEQLNNTLNSNKSRSSGSETKRLDRHIVERHFYPVTYSLHKLHEKNA
jgi:hypothetical protein